MRFSRVGSLRLVIEHPSFNGRLDMPPGNGWNTPAFLHKRGKTFLCWAVWPFHGMGGYAAATGTAIGFQSMTTPRTPHDAEVIMMNTTSSPRPEVEHASCAQIGFDKRNAPPRVTAASDGVVAQLVEHHNGIVGVRGSNPLGSTIFPPATFSPAQRQITCQRSARGETGYFISNICRARLIARFNWR